MHFNGKRMAELRRTRGETREAFGARIGRGYHAMVSYELERSQPPLVVAVAIADALGVGLDELVVREAEAVAA